jgi:hypothetical protein
MTTAPRAVDKPVLHLSYHPAKHRFPSLCQLGFVDLLLPLLNSAELLATCNFAGAPGVNDKC